MYLVIFWKTSRFHPGTNLISKWLQSGTQKQTHHQLYKENHTQRRKLFFKDWTKLLIGKNPSAVRSSDGVTWLSMHGVGMKVWHLCWDVWEIMDKIWLSDYLVVSETEQRGCNNISFKKHWGEDWLFLNYMQRPVFQTQKTWRWIFFFKKTNKKQTKTQTPCHSPYQDDFWKKTQILLPWL